MYSQELKDRVAKSRDWKLSNVECARRLGITLDEYLKIKKRNIAILKSEIPNHLRIFFMTIKIASAFTFASLI